METLWSLLFFAWAGICAYAVRAVLVLMLRPRFGRAAYPLAYLGCAALFALSLLVVRLTGFRMMAFDRHSLAQWTGLVTLGFSPIGLPLLYGAPVVLVLDALTAVWHLRRRQAAAPAAIAD